MSCLEPEAIARGGLQVRFKRGDREVVAGIAPRATRRVEARVRDLIQPLHMTGRVYGTSMRTLPGYHVEVRLR
jgi:hypothetical protein